MRPSRARSGRATTFHFQLLADLPLCRKDATILFAGRRLTTDADGEASLRARLRGRKSRVAGAIPSICEPATATVRVKKGRRPRGR